MERRTLVMSGLSLLGTAAVALAAEHKEEGGKKPEKVVEPNVNPETRAEIKAVLEKHDKAFSAQDLEGVLATYHQGPYTVLMGTGPGEMWAGLEEIGDAYKHFFADFDKGAQAFRYEYVNAQTRGDVAWMSVMGEVTGNKGGKEMKFAINISGVLLKDQGQWKFSHLHFSNLTGPEK
jgi:uncharacterized protein (TIGR02246 family)